MDPAIQVDHLTKEYTLGVRARGYTTLREAVSSALTAPVRRLRGSQGGGGRGRPFLALDDVSFAVAPGESVGIIGRNGAGKSTILKMLSRITEPTAGTIAIRGRVASLLEVGTGFHPELTGRENVYLNGSLLGMRRAEIKARFDEIVAFSEVEDFLDTPVKRYSSGMYVRLAFAVAAHLEPEILIVDEVLAVGDAAFQQKCLGKMQEVGQGGRTVLFVSHNMAAITRLCPRTLLLRRGRLAFDGPSLDGVKQYLADGARPSGLVWDVASAARRLDTYGELARVRTIELAPGDGRMDFHYGEGLRFRVTFDALAALSHAGIGIGIEDLYGTRIATFNSQEAEVITAVDRGGACTMTLHVPCPPLNPGRYTVSCAVTSGALLLDFVPQAATFEVQPIHVETGAHFEPSAGAGPVTLPSEWIIE
jgi:homopolymeric O-antigen transport system ATP-binding protein